MWPSGDGVVRLQTLLVLLCGSLLSQLPQGARLEVIVTNVQRVKEDLVRLNIRVTNRARLTVFLPRMGGEPHKIHSLFIEQLQPRRGWVMLTPSHELPAFDAIEVAPSKNYEEVFNLRDPVVIRYPPQEILIHGKHRIRVGYFSSEKDWKGYLAQGASIAGLPPEKFSTKRLLAPKYAYSEPFEIPPRRSKLDK